MENVPGGWETLLLALAAYRVTRLIGWDTLTERLRNWLMVRKVVASVEGREGESRRVVVMRSPLLSKLINCPWCLGWWISLAWWAAWIAWPAGTLVAATPFAIAAIVGLVSKNLDP